MIGGGNPTFSAKSFAQALFPEAKPSPSDM